MTQRELQTAGLALLLALAVSTARARDDKQTTQAPHEGSKSTQPAYVIDAPDLLRMTVKTGSPKHDLEGEFLVGCDGTVSLGTFGRVNIAGMTVDQACQAVKDHMKQYVDTPRVALDVQGYNSKFYYVIAGDKDGQQVVRFPCTGKETVLDAVAQIGGLPPVAAKLWVSRPSSTSQPGCVLPVDWKEVVHHGDTRTNYQLMPGDRVLIQNTTTATSDTHEVLNALSRCNAVSEKGTCCDKSSCTTQAPSPVTTVFSVPVGGTTNTQQTTIRCKDKDGKVHDIHVEVQEHAQSGESTIVVNAGGNVKKFVINGKTVSGSSDQKSGCCGDALHDILTKVQETPTASLIFGVGVNSDAGVCGSIALNEKNFSCCKDGKAACCKEGAPCCKEGPGACCKEGAACCKKGAPCCQDKNAPGPCPMAMPLPPLPPLMAPPPLPAHPMPAPPIASVPMTHFMQVAVVPPMRAELLPPPVAGVPMTHYAQVQVPPMPAHPPTVAASYSVPLLPAPVAPSCNIHTVMVDGKAKLQIAGPGIEALCDSLSLKCGKDQTMHLQMHGKQILIKSNDLQAVADQVTQTGNNGRICLQGNVQMESKKNNMLMKLKAGQVIIGLNDGYLEVQQTGSLQYIGHNY